MLTAVDAVSDGRAAEFVVVALTRACVLAAVEAELGHRGLLRVTARRLADTAEIGLLMPPDEVPREPVTHRVHPRFRVREPTPPQPDGCLEVLGPAASWVHFVVHALLPQPLTDTSAYLLCVYPHPERDDADDR